MTREEAKNYLENYRKMYAGLAPERFLEALDIILSEPSFPSNLDEAAEEYLKQYNESEFGNGGDDWDDDIIITFKAGAEWMAGQGYTTEETVYFERLCDENRIMVDFGWGEPERGGFQAGDRVIVQIRKKKEI